VNSVQVVDDWKSFMRDVVVIGGGLSGLAAAAELETLKIPYRLIEVKKRLGGSIATIRKDGFLIDTGAFAFPRRADWSFLSDLGLEDALIDANDWHKNRSVAFKNGTQSVTDALASRLKTGTFIHRMAVSSIGYLDGRYVLCMENGLVLEAGALVVAAPARHTERMFRTLAPEFSQRLLNYGYDTITRVALGYPAEHIGDPGKYVWGDMAVAFYHTTDDPNRVPPGHTLIQLGVRFPLERTTPEALIGELRTHIGWPENPVMSHISVWPEADPLPPHTRTFHEEMAVLQNLLPEGVALAGGDYHGLGLAARIEGGRAAARRVAEWLKA
jgi:protoporphyrinogen oxidase